MSLFSVEPPSRKPLTKWVFVTAVVLIAAIAALLLTCACAGPAAGRVQRSRPIKLIHFEIKTESGKVISDVKTWEYDE